jgi:hypothetical protein
MKKFLVLYKASAAEFQKAMSSTPEQQKAGMDAWMAWSQKAKGQLLDMGGPLGKAVKVSSAGKVEASPNDLGGFSVMQAESKEALAKTLEGHPHFMMGPSSTIEVVEIMAIPGM